MPTLFCPLDTSQKADGEHYVSLRVNPGSVSKLFVDQFFDNAIDMDNVNEQANSESDRKIFSVCMKDDPLSRFFFISKVHSLFEEIFELSPYPRVYISPQVLEHVDDPISVRKLIRFAGRLSGLVMELKSISRKSKVWANAWLRL